MILKTALVLAMVMAKGTSIHAATPDKIIVCGVGLCLLDGLRRWSCESSTH